MKLHVYNLLNRVVDGLDPHDDLTVDQPEPELAARAPAGLDALMAGEGPHQLEGVPGHVFKDRVELRRWTGLTGTTESGGLGRRGSGLGRIVFLELHDQGAHVPTNQSNQDGLGLVLLAGKNVSSDDALLDRWQVPQSLNVDSSLEDWSEELVIHLVGHNNWVFFVTLNHQLEDTDTAAAAVLLHVVDSRLELQDLAIFVEQLVLEVGIFVWGSSQDRFQLLKTGGLLVEPSVGGSELIIVGRELLTDAVELSRECANHLLQGTCFFLAGFFRHLEKKHSERFTKTINSLPLCCEKCGGR